VYRVAAACALGPIADHLRPPPDWGCILERRGYKMAALFTSLAAALITDKPAPGGPQLYELMVDASLGHAPAARAHSPLR
jgi:hypothetical protein